MKIKLSIYRILAFVTNVVATNLLLLGVNKFITCMLVILIAITNFLDGLKRR